MIAYNKTAADRELDILTPQFFTANQKRKFIFNSDIDDCKLININCD